MPTRENLHETLTRLVRPGMTVTQMWREAKAAHPKASKKEIIRAAFGSMIEIADTDPERARQLQDFALTERRSEDLH